MLISFKVTHDMTSCAKENTCLLGWCMTKEQTLTDTDLTNNYF